jgi:hypothetical protein
VTLQAPLASTHTHVRARVFHNAVERGITFKVGDTVEQCDTQAVDDFKIGTNPHTFGLYRADGIRELLPITARIARVDGGEPPAGEVGIREEETLILRTSTVRGG